MFRKALRTARRAFRFVRPGGGMFSGSGSHRFSGFVPASDRYARNFAGNTGKASENGRYTAGRPTVGRTLLDYEKMDLDMGCRRAGGLRPASREGRVGRYRSRAFGCPRRRRRLFADPPDRDPSVGRRFLAGPCGRVFRRAGRKVAGQAACGRPERRTGIGSDLRRIGRSAGRGLCAERAAPTGSI